MVDKCDKLEKLNFDPKIKIKEGLKGASKGYYPISMEKLKEENRQLYDVIVKNMGKLNNLRLTIDYFSVMNGIVVKL